MRSISFALIAVAVAASACQSQTADPATGGDPTRESGSFVEPGTPEEQGVIAVLNDYRVTQTILDDDAGLDSRAARNLIAVRMGQDGQDQTTDDERFDNIGEVDRVAYVGSSAINKLLKYAQDNGYIHGEQSSEQAERQAVLALVNDRAVSRQTLDDDVGLDRRAANNIVDYRNGEDLAESTADDRNFVTYAELDAVPYVGDSALSLLRAYAVDNGYVQATGTGTADAVFSPQPYSKSHNVRVADIIADAKTSLDIAMYSFSDEGIFDELQNAVDRGVKVRFIFETANADRKLSGSDLDGSRSARLERMGINVRYVNKIMHHKFVLVDGPRDDAAKAATATLASGSGNWSYGAATRYDENTVFVTGQVELNLRMQREFNLMWDNSRDFVYDASLPYIKSTYEITDTNIPDEAATDAFFTSKNFKVKNATFSVDGTKNTVADAMVEAIARAEKSVHVASGHMRSRPVAEALMAKVAADPDVDVRVYLDGQEVISEWYNGEQKRKREQCIVDAGTSASKLRKCNDKGYYFGKDLADRGVDVRYKYYSYRWHYKHALQMHNKLMIIDGNELFTGSYNLSDNAEHNTLENMLVFRGPVFQSLVDTYEANFEALWGTEQGTTTYADLLDDVTTENKIPLMFTPMSLDWHQVTDLKSAIRSNCADVNSEPLRTEPWKYPTCDR